MNRATLEKAHGATDWSFAPEGAVRATLRLDDSDAAERREVLVDDENDWRGRLLVIAVREQGRETLHFAHTYDPGDLTVLDVPSPRAAFLRAHVDGDTGALRAVVRGAPEGAVAVRFSGCARVFG